MLCSRVQNLLSAYCDRELTGAEMLQIRSHLTDCEGCRRELEAILHVKRLMGALSSAEPKRPFQPSQLATASRRPWLWSYVCRATRPYLAVVQGWHEASIRTVASGFHSLRTMPARMALSGTAAITLATLALVHAPQHPDAVTAHVPEMVSIEDHSLALIPPLTEVTSPSSELLPDEVNAIQAAETIGAEQPIRSVADQPVTPGLGLEAVGYPGYRRYQAVYVPAHRVQFVTTAAMHGYHRR